MVRPSSFFPLACLTVLLTVTQISLAYQEDRISQLLKQIDDILESLKNKRGCSGYMCGHSHMSSSAASQVIKNHMYSLMWDCVTGKTDCQLKKKKKKRCTTRTVRLKRKRAIFPSTQATDEIIEPRNEIIEPTFEKISTIQIIYQGKTDVAGRDIEDRVDDFLTLVKTKQSSI